MANKRNGLDRQDSALATFKFDARSTSTNSAVQQAMRGSAERKAYRAKIEAERASRPMFVPGSAAEFNYLKTLKETAA